MVFLKISQISQESVCVSLKACTFIKKRLQYRCFPVKFEKVFKNTCFEEHLRMTALRSLQAKNILICIFSRRTSKTKLFPEFMYVWMYLGFTCSCYPPGNKTSWRRRNDVSLYVPVTSQVRLKWNTQWRLSGTSPRRLSGTSSRRLIGMSWWRPMGT